MDPLTILVALAVSAWVTKPWRWTESASAAVADGTKAAARTVAATAKGTQHGWTQTRDRARAARPAKSPTRGPLKTTTPRVKGTPAAETTDPDDPAEPPAPHAPTDAMRERATIRAHRAGWRGYRTGWTVGVGTVATAEAIRHGVRAGREAWRHGRTPPVDPTPGGLTEIVDRAPTESDPNPATAGAIPFVEPGQPGYSNDGTGWVEQGQQGERRIIRDPDELAWIERNQPRADPAADAAPDGLCGTCNSSGLVQRDGQHYLCPDCVGSGLDPSIPVEPDAEPAVAGDCGCGPNGICRTHGCGMCETAAGTCCKCCLCPRRIAEADAAAEPYRRVTQTGTACNNCGECTECITNDRAYDKENPVTETTGSTGDLPAIPAEIDHTTVQQTERQIQDTLSGAGSTMETEMSRQHAAVEAMAGWMRQVAAMGQSAGVEELGKSTQQQLGAQSEAAGQAASALQEAAEALGHAVKALGAVIDAAGSVIIKSTAAVGG